MEYDTAKEKTKFKDLKERINFYFENVESLPGTIIDSSIIALILISSTIYVALTHPLPDFLVSILEIADAVIMIIFSVEYLLRFWTAEKKIKHFFSIYSIIDLVVILPFYFGLAGLGFLMILRVFRILRLLRFIKRIHLIARIPNEDVYVLINIAFTVFSIVFVFSGLFYFTEHRANPEIIATFFDAIYYSIVTMSTVGFGDIIPISTEGRVVTIIMIASAIILIPWQISVFLKRLIRTATKVRVKCQKCGLQHHDKDAIHCKDCGCTLFNPDRKG